MNEKEVMSQAEMLENSIFHIKAKDIYIMRDDEGGELTVRFEVMDGPFVGKSFRLLCS